MIMTEHLVVIRNYNLDTFPLTLSDIFGIFENFRISNLFWNKVCGFDQCLAAQNEFVKTDTTTDC